MPGTSPGMTTQDLAQPVRKAIEWERSIESWLEVRRPQGVVVDILKGDGHHLGGPVDGDMAEELQPEARRQVEPLLPGRGLHIDELRAERAVEHIGSEGAGMDRSGHELPERIEV